MVDAVLLGGACIALKANSCFRLPWLGEAALGTFFSNSSNSPAAMPVDVWQLGPLFNDHWVRLEGAVVG